MNSILFGLASFQLIAVPGSLAECVCVCMFLYQWMTITTRGRYQPKLYLFFFAANKYYYNNL